MTKFNAIKNKGLTSRDFPLLTQFSLELDSGVDINDVTSVH